MKIEIEIQVKVDDAEKLAAYLSRNGVFKGETYQIDRYFFNDARVAERPIKEWLRLRQADGKCLITLKKMILNKQTHNFCWQEFETGIDSADVLSEILFSLGLNKSVVVRKRRRLWRLEGYEISIDAVDGLGEFVEIEYIGHENGTSAQIKNDMVAFLKKTGCGSIKKNSVGYPFQLMFPDEVEFEEV